MHLGQERLIDYLIEEGRVLKPKDGKRLFRFTDAERSSRSRRHHPPAGHGVELLRLRTRARGLAF